MKGSIEEVRLWRRQFAQDHKPCRLKFDQDIYQFMIVSRDNSNAPEDQDHD